MKARLIVAGVLTCGALVVLPAQTASACTLGLGTDCPGLQAYKSGEHNFGVRWDQNTSYEGPKAPQPSKQKVDQWRIDYWFDYPRNAEASSQWWNNFLDGNPINNPNIGARHKARDAAGRKPDLYDQYGLRPHAVAPVQESGQRMTTTGGGERVPCYIGSC